MTYFSFLGHTAEGSLNFTSLEPRASEPDSVTQLSESDPIPSEPASVTHVPDDDDDDDPVMIVQQPNQRCPGTTSSGPSASRRKEPCPK